MPLQAAITVNTKVDHPFKFPLEVIEGIEDDNVLCDFWAHLEIFRKAQLGLEDEYRLRIPTDAMFEATDEASLYLVDLYRYFKIVLSLNKKNIQEEIPWPSSTQNLPWYYYGDCLYSNVLLKGKLDKEDLASMIAVCEVLGDEIFKNNCIVQIQHCLVALKLDFFLDDDSIREISALLPDEPSSLEDFLSICANARNQFIVSSLPIIEGAEHKIYREARIAWTDSTSPLPISLTNKSVIRDWPAVDIEVGKNFLEPTKAFKYQLDGFAVRDIARYWAHITTPGPAVFAIEYPLSEVENQDLQFHMVEKLFEKGYSNSLGDLVKEKISQGSSRVERNKSKTKFIDYYIRVLKSYFLDKHRHITIDYDELRNIIATSLTSVYNPKRTEALKELETFNAISSLTLLYQTLNTIPRDSFPETLKLCLLADREKEKLSVVVRDTLIIARKTYEICKGQEFTSKHHHDEFISLAKNILKHKIKKGHSVIIQSGTPISYEDKDTAKYSKHCFYVLFKVLDKRVKIIIVNGGDGLPGVPDPRYDPREGGAGAAWLCRETEFFELNKDSEEFLKHYIYKTLMLPYTLTTDPIEPISGESRAELLENLYLMYKNPACKFMGARGEMMDYKPQICTNPNSMTSQIFANCTFYNFKFALKILFEWNEAQLSHFNANNICLFNHLLIQQNKLIEAASNNKERSVAVQVSSVSIAPTAVDSSAIGGAGYLASVAFREGGFGSVSAASRITPKTIIACEVEKKIILSFSSLEKDGFIPGARKRMEINGRVREGDIKDYLKELGRSDVSVIKGNKKVYILVDEKLKDQLQEIAEKRDKARLIMINNFCSN